MEEEGTCRVRFVCQRAGPPHAKACGIRRRAFAWEELRRILCLLGGKEDKMESFMIVQCGEELEGNAAVPSPDHDVFVLTRPTALTRTRVSFREPGGDIFHLELPLNSSLASVKKALVLALSKSGGPIRHLVNGKSTPSPTEPLSAQSFAPATSAAAVVDVTAENNDDRDCTLILRGRTMSDSCLLGDYILWSALEGQERRTTTTAAAAAAASILVMWRHQPSLPRHRTHTTNNPCEARTLLVFSRNEAVNSGGNHGGRRVHRVAAVLSRSDEVEGGGEEMRRRPPPATRRSVPRRAKSVVALSGVRKGSRCGLGVRPLLFAVGAVGVVGLRKGRGAKRSRGLLC